MTKEKIEHELEYLDYRLVALQRVKEDLEQGKQKLIGQLNDLNVPKHGDVVVFGSSKRLMVNVKELHFWPEANLVAVDLNGNIQASSDGMLKLFYENGTYVVVDNVFES